MPPRRILVVLGLVLVAAACVPVPPPAAAPPAGGGGGGTPAPTLPAAPGHGDAFAAYVDIDPDPDPAARDWQNPDAPDPFVLSVDPTFCDHGSGPPAACYYTYTTQVFFANITPVFRSTDLVTWEVAGFDGPDADTFPDGRARETIAAPWADLVGHWAPAVLARPTNPTAPFVMWYSAAKLSPGAPAPHCLGVATATSPDGPFVDTAAVPAYCQEAQGGTIDPSPFVDTDGTAYLTYKTEGTPSIPTRIWISQLAPDGLTLVPGTERLLLETLPGSWEPPIIEGPTMVRSPSGLFLFYSASRWQDSSYKVGVARCDTPLGPCTRIYSTPVLASFNAMRGPGGQTPVFDAEDNAWRMVFHAWTSPDVGYPGGKRSLHQLPLYLQKLTSGGLRARSM